MKLLFDNIARHIKLTGEEEKLFLSRLKFKTLRRKEFLLRAGELCHYENFVLNGCLRTYTIDEKGSEHVLMFAPEDWWTGDLFSFLTEKPSLLYIDALEDSEIAQISKAELENVYREIPSFERFFRIMFQKAFIAQQQRIAGNLSLSAEERLNEFRAKYPQLEKRLTQKQIAAYLGITPEFLSMLRARDMRSIS